MDLQLISVCPSPPTQSSNSISFSFYYVKKKLTILKWTVQWHLAHLQNCASPPPSRSTVFPSLQIKPPARLAVSSHSAPPPRVATTGLCSLSADHLFWGISRPVFLSLGLVFLRFIQANFLLTLVKQVLSTDRQSYCTLLWVPLATHLSTNDLFSF